MTSETAASPERPTRSCCCISHVKDVDGIASAALVLAAKGGRFRLTDYDSLFGELDAILGESDDRAASEVVICDLGTDPSKFAQFAERLERLVKKRKIPVTYIDHHYLTTASKQKLRRIGVGLHHDTSESAAMLTYLTFRGHLPDDAKLLALYGAVTDYMDGSKTASSLMERYDRQYVLLESTLLSYGLAWKGKDYTYVERLVEALAKMVPPHAIDEVGGHALEQAGTVQRLAELVKGKGKRMGSVAYMETDQNATGNVAKLLLGAFDVPLAIAYTTKKPGRMAEVSLRSTSQCEVHLGKLLSHLAPKRGGSGGGHMRAAGCSVPESEVQNLIKDIEARVAPEKKKKKKRK